MYTSSKRQHVNAFASRLSVWFPRLFCEIRIARLPARVHFLWSRGQIVPLPAFLFGVRPSSGHFTRILHVTFHREWCLPPLAAPHTGDCWDHRTL